MNTLGHGRACSEPPTRHAIRPNFLRPSDGASAQNGFVWCVAYTRHFESPVLRTLRVGLSSNYCAVISSGRRLICKSVDPHREREQTQEGGSRWSIVCNRWTILDLVALSALGLGWVGPYRSTARGKCQARETSLLDNIFHEERTRKVDAIIWEHLSRVCSVKWVGVTDGNDYQPNSGSTGCLNG